jgi:hypothetical protein
MVLTVLGTAQKFNVTVVEQIACAVSGMQWLTDLQLVQYSPPYFSPPAKFAEGIALAHCNQCCERMALLLANASALQELRFSAHAASAAEVERRSVAKSLQ